MKNGTRASKEFLESRFFKELKEEYRKTTIFRTDRVAAIKQKVSQGKYSIPTRDLTRKWFSA